MIPIEQAVPPSTLHDPRNTFFRVHDEAFTPVDIHPGDFGICRQGPIKSGTLVVVQTPDCGTILRIAIFQRDRILLKSLNPRFKDHWYSASDEITIKGGVTKIFPSGNVRAISKTLNGLVQPEEPAGLFRADTTGWVTMVTELFALSVGSSQDDVLGWGWLDTIHPEERDRIKATWLRSLKTGVPYHVSTYCATLIGGYARLDARANPVISPSREIVGWEGRCVIGARSDAELAAKYRHYDLSPRKIVNGCY